MKSIFKVLITILILMQFATTSMQNLSSDYKKSSIYNENITEDENQSMITDAFNKKFNISDIEKTDEESFRKSLPRTLPLSMNLHQKQQQDVQHLSDLNGSSIVSSHYVGERTTLQPLDEERMKLSNISLLALGNYKGTLDESFLKKINSHWLKFPPQSPTAHYILASVYFIFMIFGLSGNALVIFIFIKCSNVRTPANNLILNLAISDFLIMLEAPIFIYNSLYFGPASGEFACKIYGMLGATGGTVAIMTLTAISIDRYNVIVFPLNPSRSTTNIRSRLMILMVWICSLPFCVVPFLEIGGVGGYIPEGFLTACSFDYLDTSPSNYWFIFCYALAAYFVPLIIIAYCYFHILFVVLSAKKIQSSKEKNKTEVRLAAIVMGIIGLWAFAWTPYCIVSLIGILGYAENLSPLASMIPAIMAKTAACIDPYLYAVTHPRFRKELEILFCSSRFGGEGSNFQTSYYSRGTSRRRGGRNVSECESIEIGCNNNNNLDVNAKRNRLKSQLNTAESSFCEDSTISMDIPVKC